MSSVYGKVNTRQWSSSVRDESILFDREYTDRKVHVKTLSKAHEDNKVEVHITNIVIVNVGISQYRNKKQKEGYRENTLNSMLNRWM